MKKPQRNISRHNKVFFRFFSRQHFMAISWTVCNDMKYILLSLSFLVWWFLLSKAVQRNKNEISSGEIFSIINQIEKHKSRRMNGEEGECERCGMTSHNNMSSSWHSQKASTHRVKTWTRSQITFLRYNYNLFFCFYILSRKTTSDGRGMVDKEKRAKSGKDIVIVHGRYYCRKLHQKQYPWRKFLLLCFCLLPVTFQENCLFKHKKVKSLFFAFPTLSSRFLIHCQRSI